MCFFDHIKQDPVLVTVSSLSVCRLCYRMYVKIHIYVVFVLLYKCIAADVFLWL